MNGRELPSPDEVVSWLREMPAQWLDELQQATLEGDLLKIASVIADGHTHKPELATALLDMANNFAHDHILEIIAEAVSSPS